MNNDTVKVERAHTAVRVLGCMLRIQVCVLRIGDRAWHSVYACGLGKLAEHEFTRQFTPLGEMRGLSASELLQGQSLKYLSMLCVVPVVRRIGSDAQ